MEKQESTRSGRASSSGATPKRKSVTSPKTAKNTNGFKPAVAPVSSENMDEYSAAVKEEATNGNDEANETIEKKTTDGAKRKLSGNLILSNASGDIEPWSAVGKSPTTNKSSAPSSPRAKVRSRSISGCISPRGEDKKMEVEKEGQKITIS